MPKEWVIEPPVHDHVSAAGKWNVPEILAHLLLNRGVRSKQDADRFLSPNLKELHPPSTLQGAVRAADLIIEIARSGRRIVLYGDYDVDGTTGVAILWHMLKAVGASVSYYIPHRVLEGYGLRTESALQLVREGAECIVTIDCGITALEAAEALSHKGIPLIITDHHASSGGEPNAAAIVHPGLDEKSLNPDLCGAGVAFKLAWAIAQRHCDAERVTDEFRALMLELLPLAALGTIADIVPLTGENRIIAKHGLALLPQTPIPGLLALMDVAGLTARAIGGSDVGFKLAPRLNAAGRMGHAKLAVELLTEADHRRGKEIALYLDDHNRTRQATERRVTKKAIELIEERNLAGDHRRAIVVSGTDWHPGVIGIVAARLVGRYHRPAVVIAMNNGKGQGEGKGQGAVEGQGSARSIAPFHLARALGDCGQELISHGGHAMAAGLRIAADRVDAFAEKFVSLANNRLTGHDLLPRLILDAEVELRSLTMAVTQDMHGLGPHGTGNPQPRFATDWLELAGEPRCVGARQDHLQVTFRQNGAQLKAIGFGMAHMAEDLKQHRRCRAAFEPIISDFRGRRTVEMQLLDLKMPGDDGPRVHCPLSKTP